MALHEVKCEVPTSLTKPPTSLTKPPYRTPGKAEAIGRGETLSRLKAGTGDGKPGRGEPGEENGARRAGNCVNSGSP